MRNIRQNLFFAVVYNAVGIPVAAGALYPFVGLRLSPVIAAAAMALSSLSVVGNANRLRRFHTEPLPETGAITVIAQVEIGSRPAARRQTDAGTLHFCSAHCAATYDAEPDRYATAKPGGGGS